VSSTPPKPRLFVGSSRESLPFAYAVQENLEYDAFVKVWRQGVFRISNYGLDSLVEALRSHDFGVFVFAADDRVIMRHKRYGAVRDNVLFELGLFMGGLGRDRTFVLVPRGVDLHLPTDLLGLNAAEYDPTPAPDDLAAALGAACNKIRLAMRPLGPFRPGAPTTNVVTIREPIQAQPSFRRTSGPGKPAIIPLIAAEQMKSGSGESAPGTKKNPRTGNKSRKESPQRARPRSR
jgi:hypothetical protein